MTGNAHQFVANVALACLDVNERHILYPRWGGIESGATLSDEFRIMWEPIDSANRNSQLVHRCFIDSDDSKDHGGVTRALDHSLGSITFIEDYQSGKLGDSYNENEFLENLGMFLGIASHHISDLCTPVHVGHQIDFRKLGFKSMAKFHSKVERDIDCCLKDAVIKLSKPRQVKLTKNYFFNIARNTYDTTFLKLKSIYSNQDERLIIKMTSDVISAAVKHTADVWHTVLSTTKMTKRTWSQQPLL